MAPITTTSVFTALAVTGAAAYAPASTFGGALKSRQLSQSSTRVYENFGFDFAEDMAENTPDIILGEANYKQWVTTVNDNSFLNRQVCA